MIVNNTCDLNSLVIMTVIINQKNVHMKFVFLIRKQFDFGCCSHLIALEKDNSNFVTIYIYFLRAYE